MVGIPRHMSWTFVSRGAGVGKGHWSMMAGESMCTWGALVLVEGDH